MTAPSLWTVPATHVTRLRFDLLRNRFGRVREARWKRARHLAAVNPHGCYTGGRVLEWIVWPEGDRDDWVCVPASVLDGLEPLGT